MAQLQASTVAGTLTTTGNVGIGITNPTARLQATGVTTFDAGIIASGNTVNGVGLGLNNANGNSWYLISTGTSNGGGANNLGFYNATQGEYRVYFKGDGNVGINTTSPLTKLHIGNNVSGGGFSTFGSYQIILYNTGTATDSYGIGIESGTMMFNADDNYAFYVENSKRMVIEGNNVGIGTANPSTKLEVGNFLDAFTNKITVSSRYEYEPEFNFKLGQSGTNLNWIGAVISSGDDGNYNGKILFKTANAGRDTPTTKMVIKANGNVGIGSDSPAFKLDVNGNIRTQTGYIQGANSSADLTIDGNIGSLLRYGNQKILLNSSNAIVYTADTVRLFITNGGNIGIGTESPSSILQLLPGPSYTTNSSYQSFQAGGFGVLFRNAYDAYITFNTTYSPSGWVTKYGGLKSGIIQITDGVFSIDLGTGTTAGADPVFTQRFVVTNAGAVGIGTNATVNGSKLEVRGSGVWDGGVITLNNTGTGGRAWSIFSTNDSFGQGGGRLLIYNTTGGSDAMVIDSSNQVGIGTNNPAEKLDLTNGKLRFTNTTSGRSSTIGMDDNYNFYIKNTAAGNLYIGNGTTTYVNGAFQAGSDTVTIQSGGNVGIGTLTPTSKLSISDGVAMYGAKTGVMLDIKRNVTNGNDTTSRTGIRLGNNSNAFDIYYGGTSDRLRFLDGGDGEVMSLVNGGNVGIGTTNPSQKLEVNGYILSDRYYPKSSNSTYIYGDGGGVSIGGSGYFYSNGSGGSYFQGIVRFRNYITDDTNAYLSILGGTSNITYFAGNVGIGLTNPSVKLEVNGNIKLSSTVGQTATPSYIWLGNDYSNGTTRDKLKIYLYNSGTEQYGFAVGGIGDIQYHSNAYHDFYINNSLSVRINPSGNVGISSSSPAQKLDVAGNIKAFNVIFWNNGVGALSWDTGLVTMETNSATAIVLKTNSSERMRILSGGNVGIGITTPGATFVVGAQSSGQAGSGYESDNSILSRFGASNSGRRMIGLTIANTAAAAVGNDASLSFVVAGNYSATGIISTVLQNTSTAYSDMVFSTYNSGNQERMRINGVAGNVGIGTNDPGRRLDVREGNVQIVANFQNTSTTSSRIKFTDANTGAENVNIGAIGTRLAMWTNNTERMSIVSGGNVGIGVTNPLSKLQSQVTSNTSALFLVNSTGGGGSYVDLDFNTYDPYQAGYANPGATIRVIDDGAYSGDITFRTKGASIGASQTERVRIKASNGNFGIGTNSPAAKLHVNGTLRVDNGGDAPGTNTPFDPGAVEAYYGGSQTTILGRPDDWLLINVSGTDFVIPLYTAP
jgi:hypothetical protein